MNIENFHYNEEYENQHIRIASITKLIDIFSSNDLRTKPEFVQTTDARQYAA